MFTRFAPAPTGLLHLGHVVNALYVWGAARAVGARVLLRIEDHDRQRSRRDFEAAIREDLSWLGFVPDLDAGRQSDRYEIYERQLAALRARGLVYACECSRADVLREGARVRLEPDTTGGLDATDLWYPGTCSAKGLPEQPGRGVRVRLQPSIERFDDVLHGTQEQRPSGQCGDLLLRDRDGNWTYQFAATVDDYLEGVTLVVRGDDLLSSTGRQIQLARLLGREAPPAFLHHPLVMKTPQQKLSKADRDTSVRDLRAAGRTAADVVGEAMQRAALTDSAGPIDAGAASERLAAQLAPALRRSSR